MATVIALLFSVYIVFLGVLIAGWFRIMNNIAQGKLPGDGPFVSVIIPARNEESAIGQLLSDLSSQHYSKFQVIVVDDQSQDHTFKVAEQYSIRDDRFSVMKANGEGKKLALMQGISVSRGSIIITTDADCRVTVGWIEGLCQYFAKDSIEMVIGSVRMIAVEKATLYSEIQSLEFASLIGTAAATSGLGVPIMCNGANLAFRKEVFEEVAGYEGNLHIPSGDDEFLMRKVLRKYPDGVVFAVDPLTTVTTFPNRTLKEFVQQRIRWAGKWKHNQSGFSVAIALLVFFFNASFICFPILLFYKQVSASLALLFLLKVAGELLFLTRITLFLRISWSWHAFILLQAVYPFYVVTIGLLANFSSFEWKGRSSKL